MRKRLWLSAALFCWFLVTFLAGCTSSEQSSRADSALLPTTSPAAASLIAVDWANFTYASSCYGNTQPFHVKHGQAVNNEIHFVVYAVTYGDLTGDGQPEAVVPYQCFAADAAGVRVVVYTGNAASPRLLGDLPNTDPRGTIGNVTRIAISHQELQLAGDGYSSGAPHCCPDLSVKTTYKWDGAKFVTAHYEVSKR